MTAATQGQGIVRSLRALAIIPARLASQRLPRKMLLRAGARALFAHTARNVIDSGAFARVIVATDSDEIAEEARREGVEARLTSPDHPSGSDRAAEVWRALAAQGESADVIVNVQGDEPELDPADLAALVRVFVDPALEAATLATPILDPSEVALPSIVKVVCNRDGDALYFSRAPIPARGHAPQGSSSSATHPSSATPTASGTHPSSATHPASPSTPAHTTSSAHAQAEVRELCVHRRHVGVYAYRPEALLRFCALPHGTLEKYESLEQLRWLEAGHKMRVVAASRAPQGIDTMHDFEQFVARLRARETGSRPAPSTRTDLHTQIQVRAG